MSAIFFKGMILGMAISMPMGPISILCIQRTLFHGIKIGLLTAMGSALADGVFSCIAAFGLTAIADFLTGYQTWIHLIGAIFLIYLGISMLRSPPQKMDMDITRSTTPLHALISAFFLTMTNPITLFSFMAVFAGIGLGSSAQGGYQHALLLVLGIMTGSTLWEFTISMGVKLILQHRVNETLLKIINIISGSTILAFAAFSFKF